MKNRLAYIGLALFVLCSCGLLAAGDDIPEYPMVERFKSFTTGPDLIVLRIASPSHKETHVIVENPDWCDLLQQQRKEKLAPDAYVEFMTKNHNQVFQVTDELYDSLVKNYEAELLPEHQELKGKGRRHLVERYMRGVPLSDATGDADLYTVCLGADLKLSKKERNSLARLFIDEGIRVFRDCESGFWIAIARVPRSRK